MSNIRYNRNPIAGYHSDYDDMEMFTNDLSMSCLDVEEDKPDGEWINGQFYSTEYLNDGPSMHVDPVASNESFGKVLAHGLLAFINVVYEPLKRFVGVSDNEQD